MFVVTDAMNADEESFPNREELVTNLLLTASTEYMQDVMAWADSSDRSLTLRMCNGKRLEIWSKVQE
jgi:hypothetical protein